MPAGIYPRTKEWKKKVDEAQATITETQDQVSSYYAQLPILEKQIND